jgi:hypothetical protein
MSNGSDYEAIFESDDYEGLSFGLSEGKWEESDEESAIGPKYQKGPTPLPFRRRPFRPIGGVAGASLQTPAGKAQVQFGKPMATQEAVNNLARELKSEISSLAASVKKVNETVDKNTAVLDKKINKIESGMNKSGQQTQMMGMLPLLSQAKIEKVTMKPIGGTETTYEVSDTKYKSDMLPLLMVMMMGGGFGGSGSDQDNMSMMMLAIALSGGLS